ncbi:MAG: FAD-dependent monooxygenase [Methylobacteriaceae bacterium]|nr:FAD-dependent monooxygenase [Methylobacteriaceae bacterium]
MNETIQTDVLVVGAGPVGLSLAIELGLRGIAVTVVEQRLREGPQPRAKTTNARSMQHMRRWGIAEALRAAAPLPYDYPTDIVFTTALFGKTLAVIENAFEGAKRCDPRFPEPAQWVPQYTVEKVLHGRIASLPSVRLLSGTALEDFTQSASGVTATIHDLESDSRRSIRADYLVGADGARSRVRAVMGANMQGDHAFGHNYNLIVRIPELAKVAPAQRAIMYWVVNPQAPGVLSPLDGNEIWAFGVLLPPGVKEIADDEIKRRIGAAIGRPMAMEIVERDLWAAHRLIADRYRDRRVLLAGDACHLHPPYGGYGMNLGIADGVDLGWKLSAVLQGWGGDTLLESYEQERRAVHQRTITEAVTNYSTLPAHLLKENLDADSPAGERARAEVSKAIVAAKTREFKTLGVVLGSRYENSPIIVDDGSAPPVEHHANFQPSAHPGCLAPHAWLDDGTSLYDHFGLGYSLLLLADAGARAADAIESAAHGAAMPLKRIDLRGKGLETLYEAPLALIRPDQYVAWRGSRADAVALIDTIRGVETGTPARRAAS